MAEAYAHIGVSDPPVHEDEREGLTCDDCDAHMAAVRAKHEENFAENWAGLMFTSVPGGASVARMDGTKGAGKTAKESRKHFEKGMDDYRTEKKAGLAPTSTNVGGVEKAYKKAERNERLRVKHERGTLQDKGIFLEKPLKQIIGVKE